MVAFARRNPLTMAGVCVGLLIGFGILLNVEGRITHVARQQTVVEHRIIKIGTCAAKPNSAACLKGITSAVRRCLADFECHNLIAGADIIAVPAPEHHRTRSASSPPRATSAPAGPAVPLPSSPATTTPPPPASHHVAASPHRHRHHTAPVGSPPPLPETPIQAPQQPPGADQGAEHGQGHPHSHSEHTQAPSASIGACVGNGNCAGIQLAPSGVAAQVGLGPRH